MHQSTTKPSCFHPISFQSLMIRIEGEPSPYLSHSDPIGQTYDAAYINTRTGEIVRRANVGIPADVRIHLFASKFAGWYFVVQYSSFYSRYGCSCPDGRAFQQIGKPCEHMRKVAAREHAA